MFSVEIKLNEEKIKMAGRHSYIGIMAELDSLFLRAGMKNMGNGSYQTVGDKNDMSSLMIVNTVLRKAPWFMPYVVTWKLHEYAGDNKTIIETDDVKDFYANKYGYAV
jgi:hypothetical protein